VLAGAECCLDAAAAAAYDHHSFHSRDFTASIARGEICIPNLKVMC
jgi:hypothetical protein